MTTRIEIKNIGPGEVEVSYVTPGVKTITVLEPGAIDSVRYVYPGQEVIVKEK